VQALCAVARCAREKSTEDAFGQCRAKFPREILSEIQKEIQKNITAYRFVTVAVDGKPEAEFMCSK